MRDYGRISPLFWTRGTGRELRGKTDAQLVALYLCSCPNATMIGVYYLPVVTLAHETGMTEQRALAALAACEKIGFAHYDVASELVWVPKMAAYQIGETVDPKDKRRSGPLRAELAKLGRHRFAREFWSRYGEAYQLGPYPFAIEPDCIPVQSADAGLHSVSSPQEQEQDQEQDQEQEQDSIAPNGAPTLPGVDPSEPKTAKAREPAYGMREDWQPSVEHAKRVQDAKLHLGRVVDGFRAYWREKGERKTTKNWNLTFGKNLQRVMATDWLLAQYRLSETEIARASWPPIGDPQSGPTEGLTDAEAQAQLDAAIADLDAHTTTEILREVQREDVGSAVRLRPPPESR